MIDDNEVKIKRGIILKKRGKKWPKMDNKFESKKLSRKRKQRQTQKGRGSEQNVTRNLHSCAHAIFHARERATLKKNKENFFFVILRKNQLPNRSLFLKYPFYHFSYLLYIFFPQFLLPRFITWLIAFIC